MSLVGKSIGRLRITEKLGEGGMGVVYRAEDPTLGRSVAIKVLRAESSRDPDRVRRFAQEARAASALNHPNIVTVHDAGEFEGAPYLVMELVEGESLRAKIERGGFAHLGASGGPLRAVLDIGIQSGTALARAHESGITHRDLKPENILVRPDGYVKILDFGLAKLKERERPPAGSATASVAEAARTTAGGIVGTAAYMSPEQAQGREADGRSDVFSLALVLLECWQGRNPFARATVLDTLHAIVHDRLPAASFAPASVEWALGRILEKALEKEPDERYQTMKDLAIDLRRLKQDSESGKFTAPAAVAAPPAARRQPGLLSAGVALVLGASLLVTGLVLLRRRRAQAPAAAQYIQLTNFTDSATQPALSPDGRMLAFIRGEGTFVTPGQIYLKLLPSGEPVQLTRDQRSKMSPVFSPDGSRIAYTVLDGHSWDTWVVPVLGGEPRQMLPNASGLTWIGERQLLFSEIKKGYNMAIASATESRTEARDIYVPPTELGMAHRSYLSPDRKWVLVVEMDSTGFLPCRLLPFDGSSAGRPVGPPSASCMDGAWSPDGRWMFFSSNAGGSFRIWRQRFPDGTPEQITFGATEEEGIALAADGESFVTSIGTRQSIIWLRDAGSERQISSEGYAFSPSFSPDEKYLYYLLQSGSKQAFVRGELWKVELDSGGRERLLTEFLLAHYDLSPDSKRIVFSALDPAGKSQLWLASLDRRFPPRQLAPSDWDVYRAFYGPQSDLFFLAAEGKQRFVYRMKEDGSERRKVIPDPVIFLINVSPDGQWLILWVPVSGGEVSNAVRAYPTGGGQPVLICDVCIGGAGGGRQQAPLLSWSPDGKFLFVAFRYIVSMVGKTFVIPLRPGEMLPKLPQAGIKSESDLASLPGVRMIPQRDVFPGPNPSVYAFSRTTAQRNLYRIPLQ